MKRRDYLKNMGLSSLGLAVFNPDEKAIENLELAKTAVKRPNGRTQEEAEMEARLQAEVFLNKHELDTITILSDIIIPADGVLNEFLVRRGRLQAQGDVPVMDSLGVLFQHAAFFARIARTTGAGVSRHQMYLQPSAAMVAHVRQFSGQPALSHNFSGDR